jgi:hypothetical protein
VFDDSKKNAVESGAKPSGSVIIEGQLRVGPSGAVNVLPPTSGARAGSNTATDADPDEEHRAASVPPFRIMP